MAYASSNYLMLTTVREQAGMLDELVATVRAQERPPVIWVVLDDGSSDDTMGRLRRAQARDPWIHGVSLPRTANGDPRRPADLLAQGFRVVAEKAEADRISYRYMVNLAADLRCPPNLMAELVARSDRDRGIGIASCVIGEVDEQGSMLRQRTVVDGLPRGDIRVWRRECLEDVGIASVPRWAETTGLRARNRGWRTPVFEDLIVEAAPPGVVRDGWRGYARHGAEGWEVGLHPLVLASEAVAASVADRDLRGIAMVAGYVEAAVSGRRRSHDPELREFFGGDLLEDQARRLLSRVPMVGRR
ncbi:MAG: glycosyltransferase family 2 protein, partial [Deltaproteobacteria bacterium]|nr:glycosyltransferase family 2 protein [Deltaproteobacteria bacterium]